MLLASAGCQHTGTIITGLLELPTAMNGIDRVASRAPGSPPTPSDEEVAVIEQEHQQRMRPLQDVSAGLLAGHAYWLRGTARFVVVVRSAQPGHAVQGLEVAESREGSRVHVICAAASECPDGSTKLRVETMRWLRKNQLESAELARAITPSDDPYAAGLSPDGTLLLRVRRDAGEQATVVRIPDPTPSL